MAHADDMDGVFERFQAEIREKMGAKTSNLHQLEQEIATLNSSISDLRQEYDDSTLQARQAGDKIKHDHDRVTSDLRKRLQAHDREHKEISATLAQNILLLECKEKEVVTIRASVAQLRKRAEKNKRVSESLTDSISENNIKIGMIELEMESVRMCNKAVHEENKKLKQKIVQRAREIDQQKTELASYKPRMLEMVDKMVVEYRKIHAQISMMDDKQKRIVAEKTCIIEQLQAATASSKKRKAPEAEPASSATPANISSTVVEDARAAV